MARIAGVDIPRDKRVVISLTYVFGIGRTTAEKIITEELVFLRKHEFVIYRKMN